MLSKSLQCLISTHSSHIVADSNFDEIKYLRKIGSKIESRNLKELKFLYNKKIGTMIFKTYLTISRAEIFFADKAILIEGDTERILLPTMMKKLDIQNSASDLIDKKIPLLSQNISIIEVGAFSQILNYLLISLE